MFRSKICGGAVAEACKVVLGCVTSSLISLLRTCCKILCSFSLFNSKSLFKMTMIKFTNAPSDSSDKNMAVVADDGRLKLEGEVVSIPQFGGCTEKDDRTAE